MPAHHFPVGSSMTTLHLCSDGTYLYWVWSPASLNEKTQKGHSVFMDVFHLSVSTNMPLPYTIVSVCLCLLHLWCFLCVFSMVQTQTGLCVADILQERVILTRKEGESSKCLNELLLSRMSRFRASHSATLAALTGSAITNTVKEEQSGNSSAQLYSHPKIIYDLICDSCWTSWKRFCLTLLQLSTLAVDSL